VSVVLAVVIYVGIKWFLPAFAGHNIFLRGIAQGLYGVAWMFTLPFIFVAGASAFISYRRRALLDSRTGLDSLRALSWQDFERLVGEAYRRRGYTIEEIGGSAPDGGVDLMLYSGGGRTQWHSLATSRSSLSTAGRWRNWWKACGRRSLHLQRSTSRPRRVVRSAAGR